MLLVLYSYIEMCIQTQHRGSRLECEISMHGYHSPGTTNGNFCVENALRLSCGILVCHLLRPLCRVFRKGGACLTCVRRRLRINPGNICLPTGERGPKSYILPSRGFYSITPTNLDRCVRWRKKRVKEKATKESSCRVYQMLLVNWSRFPIEGK